MNPQCFIKRCFIKHYKPAGDTVCKKDGGWNLRPVGAQALQFATQTLLLTPFQPHASLQHRPPDPTTLRHRPEVSYCRNLIKKPWAFIGVPYMNPTGPIAPKIVTILGAIGPGFLNQIPTLRPEYRSFRLVCRHRAC